MSLHSSGEVLWKARRHANSNTFPRMACNLGWIKNKLHSRPVKINKVRKKYLRSDYETFLMFIRSLEFVIGTWELKVFKWEEEVYISGFVFENKGSQLGGGVSTERLEACVLPFIEICKSYMYGMYIFLER